MDGFETIIVQHGLQQQILCILCGRQWREQWISMALFDNNAQIGSVCPICIRQGPNKAANYLQSVAAEIRATIDQLRTKPPTIVTPELEAIWQKIEKLSGDSDIHWTLLRKNFEVAISLREQSRRLISSVRELSFQNKRLLKVARRIRSTFALPEQHTALPQHFLSSLNEVDDDASIMLAMAEHCPKGEDWTIKVEDAIYEERKACGVRFLGLRESDIALMIDDRYEDFLATTA